MSRGAPAGYGRHVAARIGQGLLVIALAYVAVFLLLFLLPGDPVQARLNDPEVTYTQDQIDQLLAYYGLDLSLPSQFWQAVSRLLHGDLGVSLVTLQPVTERIGDALPATLQLISLTLGFALVFALVLAVIATISPWPAVRRTVTSVPAALLSVPTFVIGLAVLQVFSYQLRWFSILNSGGWAGAIPGALVLALPVSAPLARVLIENAGDIQREPFVTFARSKGMGTAALLWAHVARPAALPGVTMVGLMAAELITGTVIVERIFNRDGLGSVIESAVTGQDSPVLLGVILLAATTVVLVNLAVDLTYPLLDPRIRLRADAAGGPVAVPTGERG